MERKNRQYNAANIPSEKKDLKTVLLQCFNKHVVEIEKI